MISFHTLRYILCVPVLGWIVAVNGCADTLPVVPGAPASTLLYSLDVGAHGITMAVGDSVKLPVSARNILGDSLAIPDSTPVRYIVDPFEDTLKVTINDAGIIHALAPTPIDSISGPTPLPLPVRILVHLQTAEVSKQDTIYVAVTDTAYPVTTLRLAGADSTWFGWTAPPFLSVPAIVTTKNGAVVSSVYVYLSTQQRRQQRPELFLDATSRMMWLKFVPGERFWVYGDALAYGTVLHDSVQYLATDPVLNFIVIQANPAGRAAASGSVGTLINGEMTLAPCATVHFSNALQEPITFRFPDPSATSTCVDGDETGDIIALGPSQEALRKFRTVGRHLWVVERASGVPFNPKIGGTIRIRSHTEL